MHYKEIPCFTYKFFFVYIAQRNASAEFNKLKEEHIQNKHFFFLARLEFSENRFSRFMPALGFL